MRITPINANGCYELISCMHHWKDTLSATRKEAVSLMKFLKSILGERKFEEELKGYQSCSHSLLHANTAHLPPPPTHPPLPLPHSEGLGSRRLSPGEVFLTIGHDEV